MVIKMSRKSIRIIMLFILLIFCIQFIVLSYYNFFISSIIKPMGVVIGATLIGTVFGTVGFAFFQVFYAKFLERADGYLDKHLIEEELSVEEQD